MPQEPFPDKELEAFVAEYRGQSLNLSATARAMGLKRPAAQRRLRAAMKRDMLDECEISPSSTPTRETYLSARTRKMARWQKKQTKGAWDKPVLINIKDGPFRLKLFGDPHLDADGCDFEHFEREWRDLDPGARCYGVCIGDWFNNWLRVLGHLWKDEGDPDDAWVLFEHLMQEHGAGLIGACSGNHDDWSHGPADPIDMLMKQHGVVYRQGAVRLMINAGGAGPITVALRHKWKGHSQFAPSHALRKAAMNGWHDHVMVGGHTHQDEDRYYVSPRSGFVSHLFQVSAFKKYDDFADVHGFMPHSVSPVRDLVIDPRRDDNDPDKVKSFFDSASAAAYLAAISP